MVGCKVVAVASCRSSWALRALLLRSPLLPACGPVAPPAGLAALSVALARAVALWLPAGLWWALRDEEGGARWSVVRASAW